MRRVLIIGIDALEYDIVMRLKLKNIQQAVFGRLEIKPEYFEEKSGVPFTPIVWGTIISGLRPSQHGIKEFYTYGRFLDFIRKLPIIRHIKGKKAVFSKIGIKPRMHSLKGKTFFDKIQPSIAIYVPDYNANEDFHIQLSAAIKKGVDEYVRTIEKIHTQRVFETVVYLRANWRLFMTYFDVLDLLGHIYFVKYPKKLDNAYRRIDRLVKRIKQSCEDPELLTIIVSDHGMEDSGDGITGNHSKHAF